MGAQGAVRCGFAAEAVLGCIGCLLGRSDYNMPIFAYMFLVFFDIASDRRKRQQIALLLLVAISVLPDIAYMLYWPGRWFRKSWYTTPDHTRNTHWLLLLTVALELTLKLGLLLLLTMPHVLFAPCKSDEFTEVEIATFSATPTGRPVYEVLPSTQ